ncbi:hypothetical protein BDV96DRAFT_227232 [Lophiotrema nucula]|uniref:Uncharacterized protein n=1 Tax=Lophiotrema nucula TaxID=690887 RepID=A0A6A5YUW0_9PLEO|nr:hypothetical protein BDV96DRAFT_227232 [Lophiotrema nucula]
MLPFTHDPACILPARLALQYFIGLAPFSGLSSTVQEDQDPIQHPESPQHSGLVQPSGEEQLRRECRSCTSHLQPMSFPPRVRYILLCDWLAKCPPNSAFGSLAREPLLTFERPWSSINFGVSGPQRLWETASRQYILERRYADRNIKNVAVECIFMELALTDFLNGVGVVAW